MATTISAGSAYIDILPRFTGFESKVSKELAGLGPLGAKAEKSLSGIPARLKSIGPAALDAAGGIAAVAAAVATFAAKGVSEFVEVTAEIRKLKGITGATAEDASKLVAVMHALGVNADDGARAFGVLAKNVVNTPEKFRQLGVEIEHNRDGSVDLYETFLNVGAAMQKTGAGAQSTAIALTLLGRGGKDLLPILLRTREELQGFAKDAERRGLIFSAEDLDQAREYGLASREMGEAIKALEIQIGKGLVPVITNVTKGVTSGIDATNRFASSAKSAGVDVKTYIPVLGSLISTYRAFHAATDGSETGVDRTRNTVEQLVRTIPVVGNALGFAGEKLHVFASGSDDAAKKTDELADRSRELDEALSSSGGTKKFSEEAARALATLSQFAEHSTASRERIRQLADEIGIDLANATDKEREALQKAVTAISTAITPTERLNAVTNALSNTASTSAESYNAFKEALSATVGAELDAEDALAGYDAAVRDLSTAVAGSSEAHGQHARDVESATIALERAKQSQADIEREYAEAVIDGQRRVADSEEDLADLRGRLGEEMASAAERFAEREADAAQKVIDAEERLADARRDAAQRQNDDIDAINDARQAIIDYNDRNAAKGNPELERQVREAQEARRLTDAYTEAQERAALNQAESAQKIADAEQALAKAQQERAKLEVDRAQIGRLNAQQERELAEATKAIIEARAELSKIQNAGIDPLAARSAALEVAEATESLRKVTAEQGVAQADVNEKVRGYVRAAQALTDAFVRDGRLSADAAAQKQFLIDKFNAMIVQSPQLRGVLQGYIDDLGRIPTTKDIQITASAATAIAELDRLKAQFPGLASEIDRIQGKLRITGNVDSAIEVLNRLKEQFPSLASGIDGIQRKLRLQATVDARQASQTLTGLSKQIALLPTPFAGLASILAVQQARGSVLQTFAGGGEHHVAQFAPAGAMRLWAEPETGGESYIPLAPSKRKRSIAIWEETGRRLGVLGRADGDVTSGVSPGSAAPLVGEINQTFVNVREPDMPGRAAREMRRELYLAGK